MPEPEAIPNHPLLEKLEQSGTTNPLTLRGYVGPSSLPDHIRLYARLDDLSEFAEISRDDVVHVEPAPESELPFGGSVLWVKEGANVSSTAVVRPDKGQFEVRRGRLQIMVRNGQRLTDVCQSRCQVCTSRCQVCQSRCSAVANPAQRFGNQFGNFGTVANQVCQSRCQVCTSRCKVCQSRCSAVFDPGLQQRFGNRFGNFGTVANQVCQSRCQVCTSRCKVCQSRCSAGFDPGLQQRFANRFGRQGPIAGGFEPGGFQRGPGG